MELAEHSLQKAGAVGVLPTPISDLVRAASITEINSLDSLRKGFLSKLKKKSKETFGVMIQKVRGIADLRERVNYIPTTSSAPRDLFTKSHDLGHQVIPWHKIDPAYLDGDLSLSSKVEVEFEQEASFFASEVIFQGKFFRAQALDYTPSIQAAFKLSDSFGASRQATLWRYVQEHDEAIAIAQYYPMDAVDDYGNKIFRHWKTVPSYKFERKYRDIELPPKILTNHPWAATRDINDICDGIELLVCGDSRYEFEWQAWWNNYVLLIFLRRKPKLSIVGKLLRQGF
jgi:Zn-dependent peptidase ImmA (M78 family)